MLREVDLNKKKKKKEYKEMMDKLAPKFAALQREARAKGLPVMVVFEGWAHPVRNDDQSPDTAAGSAWI